MPKIRKGANLIKIEPSPYKRSSVKVQMKVHNIAGGAPKYTTDEKGKKRWTMKQKDADSLSRLPGTVHYKAAGLNSAGTLETGLDISVPNPYSDEDFYRDGWEKLLQGKKRVRLQELLEYKHNKPKGYYTSRVSGVVSSDMAKSPEAPHYQREESRVNLRDGVTYLDLSNPLHEVQYYMLRACPEVANSYDELQNNPDITHYIVDESEKTLRENKEIRKGHKFGSRLEDIYEMPDGTIQMFCKALQIPMSSLTKDEAYKEIDGYVNRSSDKYDEFMDLYDLWKNPATKEKFLGYAELYDFMSVPGLITTRQNKVFWTQPANDGGKRELWEWKSREDFIDNFLLDPRYQEEMDLLRAQYRSKTK